MEIKFGSAGNEDRFYETYKSSLDMPRYLENMGLTAYEYQCTRGVKLSADSAMILGENAKKHNITLSIHSQYYISISSEDPEKRDKSIAYILECANIAKIMGAKRIVVHSGSAAKITRVEAMKLAIDTISRALNALDENGYSDIYLCLETMGKVNQLGDASEVVKMCCTDERLIPALDFGHINSRGLGCLKTEDDYNEIFDLIENKLGAYRAKNFHSHFSKIEYTGSGEKKHLTFDSDDKNYGPDFTPLAKCIVKRALTPIIICESAGTQAQDAVTMKKIVEEINR